jgi:hypothetical protein
MLMSEDDMSKITNTSVYVTTMTSIFVVKYDMAYQHLVRLSYTFLMTAQRILWVGFRALK